MVGVSLRQLCAKSLVAVVLLAAAWAAAGVAPFTPAAYLAMFLAVVAVAFAGSKGLASWLAHGGPLRRRARPAPRPEHAGQVSFVPVLPWLLIVATAAGLEAAGLVLGGRSSRLPTLSTVVDNLLAWHVTRWIAFLAWAWLGIAGIGRWWGVPDAGRSEQGTG